MAKKWQLLLPVFTQQLICPFQSVEVDIFEYILRSVSLTHHTWRQVQALVSVLSPPRCLENLTFLQKRSAHILSSLDQGKKRSLAEAILWKPHA